MKLSHIILTAMGFMGILTSCEQPSSPDPANTLDEIANSYSKIETGAPKEEVEAAAKLALTHYKNYVNRYKSAKDVSGAGYDVGVIPENNYCPLWSEMVVVYLDNEDSGPLTSTSGWKGAWTKEGNGDSYLKFCKVDGRLFSNMRGTFALLKLGIYNPGPASSGAYGFRGVNLVLMDNEDDGGTLITTGQANAGPNYVDGNKNARLFLTQFSWTGFGYPDVATPFPDLGFSYGVFGWPELSLSYGEYYTDDEDDSCDSDYYGSEGFDTAKETSVVVIENKKGEPTGTRFRLSKVK